MDLHTDTASEIVNNIIENHQELNHIDLSSLIISLTGVARNRCNRAGDDLGVRIAVKGLADTLENMTREIRRQERELTPSVVLDTPEHAARNQYNETADPAWKLV